MVAPMPAGSGPAHATVVRHRGVTLVVCFAINFLSSAFYRNAALFYPSIMDMFLATREQASLPLFVYGGFYHVGVLLGGTVIELLTVWAAAVAGGFLLSVTFLACYFANGILFLTLVLGVLGGLFRDTWGSYDGLFFFMASTLMVESALFAVLSAIDFRKSRKFEIPR
ncbi:uncharacterized protein LOC142574354 isoform X3 [Dermacentor variabilis]|uniref:uncharacterized protein LOC142574354 isoform X3 n=1 Tax=Dermacentor variabilis TaxID=34621 RepID=UPI003F5BCAFB